MICFAIQKKEEEPLNINLMPLIDIIFNLLIFFLITAAITTKGINIDLPEATSSKKLPQKSWEIVIDKGENITFNNVLITMDKLATIMQAEKTLPKNERVSTVILKANKNVSVGQFVSVMDMARNNNLLNLVIATNAKKAQ
jgi:biopolymer transport protein ExbD